MVPTHLQPPINRKGETQKAWERTQVDWSAQKPKNNSAAPFVSLIIMTDSCEEEVLRRVNERALVVVDTLFV